jgi:hypothetical protein
MGVKKQYVGEGEKYHFQKGGGINTVFGPKYRPLTIIWYSSINAKIPQKSVIHFSANSVTAVNFKQSPDPDQYLDLGLGLDTDP